MRLSLERARAIFGNPRPPETVWEKQFDYCDEELAQLARTPIEKIDRRDLWYYHHDLAYVDLQPELFLHLFPLCLWDWHLTLLENESCSHGDAEFHRSLVQGNVFEKMLTEHQRQGTFLFFHDSLLDRMDQCSSLAIRCPYQGDLEWLFRLNSLAIVMPQIDRLWTDWWSIGSRGQAVAAMQYVAGLMYFAEENPLFAAWPKRLLSDAEPYLTGNDSHISGWALQNVEFLKRTLTMRYVTETADRSTVALMGSNEHELAQRIRGDLAERAEIVESRIRELPKLLASGESAETGWSL